MPTVIRAEAEIDAPAERVWEILADFAAYPAWNPFTPGVETSGRPGEAVLMQVRMRPGGPTRPQRETVREMAPPERMAWGLDWGPWLHTHRVQRVERIHEHRCRYVTTNEFRGWLAPLVMALYRRDIERGFDRTAKALAARAEGARLRGAGG